jgi:hypothetical protein
VRRCRSLLISIVGFGGFENIFAGGRRVLQVVCVCGECDMKNNFQQPPKTSQSQVRDSKVRLTFDPPAQKLWAAVVGTALLCFATEHQHPQSSTW